MVVRNGKPDAHSEKGLKNKKNIKSSYPKSLEVLEKQLVILNRVTSCFLKSKNITLNHNKRVRLQL